MGVRQFTAEAYARMMKALLPPGRLWLQDLASLLSRVFLANGDELTRVSGRAADLVEESDPSTATETLAEWESALGVTDSSGTDADRQARIVARLIKQQRFRPADVKVAVAPFFGLDVTDITITEITNAQAVSTGDEKEVYRFYVYRNPALGGTYDLAAAQAEIDRISHSHVKGHAIDSQGLICDDPTGIVDQTPLGV